MRLEKRNRLSPNEIIISNDYSEVVLCDTYGCERARVKIDTDNIHKIKEYKWCLSNNLYASTKNNILLHRLIMDAQQNEYVDHINRDTLDCRKENMRICTNQQNNFNKGLYSHNTSGVSGVSWDKSRQKWEANIKINQKKIFLGRYINFEDAVKKRQEAEMKYFGEYRNKIIN